MTKWQQHTGRNLHFNAPVGITLDKSGGWERRRRPTGHHQTALIAPARGNNTRGSYCSAEGGGSLTGSAGPRRRASQPTLGRWRAGAGGAEAGGRN